MVCFSIFLPLLKGEMPEGQREFRRKALPRCAGTISRCREAFPKSSEGPRAVAKRFRRVRKVLAPLRSVSEEFGRSSRCREAFPKSSEGSRAVAKRFRRVRKVLASSRSVSEEFGRSSRRREAFPKSSEGPRAIAKPFRDVREPFRDVAKPFRGVRESCPVPNPPPPISVLLFFS